MTSLNAKANAEASKPVGQNSVRSREQWRREAITGYLFVAPSILGMVVFVLGPLVVAAALSLTKYDVITAPQFVGLRNYVRLLNDQRLATVYGNTLIYVTAGVVLINGFALVVAMLINQQLPKWVNTILRSAYFFPSLVSLVYVSLIWQALLQKDTGVVNYYLSVIGAQPVNWLNGLEWSKVTAIIVDTWRNMGFAMLIFVAALKEVPRELEEAARLDGASNWIIFRKITFPLISQATFFNITMTIIGSFQIYESIIVLTKGGPGDASRSVVMYIAEKAFSDFHVGYAAAIAMTLFLIILIVTLIQFRIRKTWVHYE